MPARPDDKPARFGPCDNPACGLVGVLSLDLETRLRLCDACRRAVESDRAAEKAAGGVRRSGIQPQ